MQESVNKGKVLFSFLDCILLCFLVFISWDFCCPSEAKERRNEVGSVHRAVDW